MTQGIIDVFAVILTLMVLSRIIGDNPLFRIAQYLFVGISLGLAFVVAYHQVLRPAISGVVGGQPDALMLYGLPLILSVLLLSRITRRQEWSWLANIPLALVFGVGAALAVGGAVAGTLAPQILDTARPLTGSPAEIVWRDCAGPWHDHNVERFLLYGAARRCRRAAGRADGASGPLAADDRIRLFLRQRHGDIPQRAHRTPQLSARLVSCVLSFVT